MIGRCIGKGDKGMDGKEIEIKIKLEFSEYERLLDFFQKTAIYEAEKHQIDMYYSPIDEDYYDAGDRCLRIRIENSQSILSYKRIHNEKSEAQYIEEYETAVSDFETMDKILKSIKFNCDMVVDKYRREFVTSDKYNIALDKIDKLGFFIEIENTNVRDGVEKRNKDLLDLIKKLELDLNARNYEGYSNMLYRINREVKING